MPTGLTIPFTGLKKQYNLLRQEILNATDEVMRSGQLMNGNHTAEFEHWLAKKNNVKHAITCHSGTHALEILAGFYHTMLSHDRTPVVLVPTLTYAATANAFIRSGWDVVLIDTDTYGILDTKKIPTGLEYDAVVMVGLYGASITHHSEVRMWQTWINRNTLILEDAAQHWLSSDCTRIGKGSAISFDPMKNLPCYGNGGAVLTNDRELAQYAREWRDNGKPTHHQIGTNSRMSEIDCALMQVKAKHIAEWQKRRGSISLYWIDRFKGTPIRCLVDNSNSHNHSFHKFVIEIDNRDVVQTNLSLRKIETKVHYNNPLHEIGAFRALQGPNMLSCASALSRRVLSLPIYPELSDLEVEYISDQVLDCVLEKHN